METVSSLVDARSTPQAPPRLDALPELLRDEGLRRSSTFRACLEKAVEDINLKYGASTTRLPDDAADDAAGDSVSSSRRASQYNTRSSFQPRYRLPQFVHVPMSRAQPAVGEVKDGSPRSSTATECIPTSLSSGFHIDEVLGEAFASPCSLRDPSYPEDDEGARLGSDSAPGPSSLLITSTPSSSVAISSTPPPAELDGREVGSPGDCQYMYVESTSGCNSASPPADVECPTPIAGSNTGTNATAADNSLPSALLSSAFSQDARKYNAPKADEPSHPLVDALKQADSAPEAGPEPAPQERPKADDGIRTARDQQRAPSVSELVSKFRRMESPPAGLDYSGARREGDPRSSQGPVTASGWYERASQDYDEGSPLIPVYGDGASSMHLVAARRRAMNSSTEDSAADVLRRHKAAAEK